MTNPHSEEVRSILMKVYQAGRLNKFNRIDTGIVEVMRLLNPFIEENHHLKRENELLTWRTSRIYPGSFVPW